MPTNNPVAVAILAKAPVPGYAKTRLIPALGAEGAAALQGRLIERTVALAVSADIGPVKLWTDPDADHPLFRSLARTCLVTLACQPVGDLGARMLAAITAMQGPTLVIGTDCPAMTSNHLQAAAEDLLDRAEVVVIPTEDGGYALIGLRRPLAYVFDDMPWGAPTIMAETRRRLAAHRLTWRELETLWDVDVADDLVRLRTAGLGHLLAEPVPPG